MWYILLWLYYGIFCFWLWIEYGILCYVCVYDYIMVYFVTTVVVCALWVFWYNVLPWLNGSSIFLLNPECARCIFYVWIRICLLCNSTAWCCRHYRYDRICRCGCIFISCLIKTYCMYLYVWLLNIIYPAVGFFNVYISRLVENAALKVKKWRGFLVLLISILMFFQGYVCAYWKINKF